MALFAGGRKYFTDAAHRHKRLYERWGNYKTYLANPKELLWKVQAKKQAALIMQDPEIRRIQAEATPLFKGEVYDKYLDFERYFIINLRRIYRLKLHKSPPLRILDLGSGCGFFCQLCKQFGHTVHGLDIPGIPIFDHMMPQFKIPRTEFYISPGQDLPQFSQQFDLIVAFAICFHEIDGGNNHWSRPDWLYFLDHVQKHVIAPQGKMHLFFNDWPHGDFEAVLERILPCNLKVKQGHKVLEFTF